MATDKMFALLIGRDPDIDALAQFISHKEDQIEIVAEAAEAMRYAEHRRQHGTPYDLAIVDAGSVTGDLLSFVAELRRSDPQMAVTLLVPFMLVDQIKPQADHLGCSAVWAKPVDLSAVQQFLQRQSFLNTTSFGIRRSSTAFRRRALGNKTASLRAQRNDPPTSATPFFGTSRVGDSSDQQPRISQEGSSAFNINKGTTSRIRRSVTASLRRGDSAVQPLTPPPLSRPQVELRSKKVMCAHCRQVFQVTVKDHAYTMPCIHCGQLNRILP